MQEINRWDRTLVMRYAELGRRPQENASLGTAHGTVNAHFVLGGKVRWFVWPSAEPGSVGRRYSVVRRGLP